MLDNSCAADKPHKSPSEVRCEDDLEKQEKVLQQFISLLSAESLPSNGKTVSCFGSQSPTQSKRPIDLKSFLVEDDKAKNSGTFCLFPSLELSHLKNSPLREVGCSAGSENSANITSVANSMATVTTKQNTTPTSGNETSEFKVPSKTAFVSAENGNAGAILSSSKRTFSGRFKIPHMAASVTNDNAVATSKNSDLGGFNIPPMTASVFPSNENISAMSNRSNTGGFKIPSMAASVFPSNENTSETSKNNRGGFNIPRMAAPVFPSNENTSVMSKISSTGGFNIPPMAASILPSNENISGMPNRSNTGGFKVPPMTSSVFPIYENTASYGKGNDTGGVMVPPMTASVFPSNENIASCGKSNKTDEFIGSSIAASVSPSLTEPNEAIDTVNKLLMATSDRTLLEQTAAQQLGVGIKWTPTNLHLAPMAMLDNFSNSFSSLLNARLKGWTLLVLKHSLSTRDTNSRNQLLKLLALTKLIETNGATTSFKASKRPTTSSKDGCKTNSMLLPLVFEARIEVSLNKKSLDVVIRAPGTISGSFTPSTSPLLESVKIELDTNSLVSNIIEEAHIILMKAVTEATLKPSVNHQVKFTKFKTALSLSKERDEKQTDKFKGEMTNLKKNASVSWNFPDQGSRKPRDVSKKAQAAANGMFGQLRSSKSFGKPDANTFECKRNATFADFGSADKSDNSKSLMRARLSGFKSTRNFTSAMDDDDLPRKNALFSAASMSLSNKLKNPFHQLDMAISDLSMVQPQADNARADTKPISGAKYSATALEQLLLLSKLPSKRKSQKTGLLPPTSEINN